MVYASETVFAPDQTHGSSDPTMKSARRYTLCWSTPNNAQSNSQRPLQKQLYPGLSVAPESHPATGCCNTENGVVSKTHDRTAEAFRAPAPPVDLEFCSDQSEERSPCAPTGSPLEGQLSR